MDCGADRTSAQPQPRSIAEVSDQGGVVGRFRLDDLVVRDVAGSVWRATDMRLNRSVSVRIVLPVDPRLEAIRVAACQAARVDDPRVVRVLDVLGVEDALVIITEWVEALSLPEILREPMSPIKAAEIAHGVASAVAVIHRRGLTHGRITPGAVLLTSDGQVVLRGHAIAAALWAPMTSAGPVGADIFGIGAVLMACLTMRWPLAAADGLAAAPVLAGRSAEPRQLMAQIPASLNEIVVRCLASARTSRVRHGVPAWVTADEVLQALARAEHELRARFARRPVSEPRKPRIVRRVAAAIGAAAAVAAVGAVGFGLTAFSGSGRQVEQQSALQSDAWRPPPRPIQTGPEVRQLPNEQPVSIHRSWALSEHPPAAESRGTRAAMAATDADPASAWRTPQYSTPEIRSASPPALVVDLAATRQVQAVDLGLVGSNSDVSVAAATDLPKSIRDGQTIAELKGASPLTTIRVPRPVTAKYLIIYFTRLPAIGDSYQGGVTNISVRGLAS